ncbi:Hypothetical predicted protein [Cloeon dipterum]|uniref:Ferritin n=1 Tax=Cloeon dipterum TaxID=197152 RepID=A0A8S1DSE3_9INSE|nr:Hypothetical predicted protein [Cloeon dipterum]
MKLQVVVIACLVAAAVAAEDSSKDFCFADVDKRCNSLPAKLETENCNAKYGAFLKLKNATESDPVSNFVHANLVNNFQYLMLATHFSNYEKNRPGFEKLYRDLSDEAWNGAIEMIKYTTKRGGRVFFEGRFDSSAIKMVVEQHELGSLAKAVDLQKTLAQEAHKLHRTFSSDELYDPDASSFLENHFLGKHSEAIRVLSGHTHDLKRMILPGKDEVNSLSAFMFDEYLQKL